MRLVATIAAGAFALSAAGASGQTYGIGTNPQGSLAYATGAAIAKVGNEQADLRMRVVPQGGPTVTIPLVVSGELQFSIANSVVASFAVRGEDEFDGRPQSDLRMAASLFPLRVGFFVRDESDIKTMADLKGRRIPTGFQRQRIQDAFTRALLATAGLTLDDVRAVPVPDGVRGVDDFATGQAESAMFSLGSGKVSQTHAAVGGLRFLSIDEANAAEMLEHAPGSFVDTVEPAPGLVGVKEPTNVLAAPFVLLTGTNTSDEAVYAIVKALHANKPALVASIKAFEEFEPPRINRDVGISYHRGAEKFFRESGL